MRRSSINGGKREVARDGKMGNTGYWVEVLKPEGLAVAYPDSTLRWIRSG